MLRSLVRPIVHAGQARRVLFLAGKALPCRLARHAEGFADARPADASRPQRCDVVGDGTVDVPMGSVGSDHLSEKVFVRQPVPGLQGAADPGSCPIGLQLLPNRPFEPSLQ